MVVLKNDAIATFQPTFDRDTFTSLCLFVQWNYHSSFGALILRAIILKCAIANCVWKNEF